MKNKKKFLIISTLLSGLVVVLLSNCSLIQNLNTVICIYDCEHGKVEVSRISESKDEIEFLVTGYPDSGYCLLSKNLYIYDNSENTKLWIVTLADQKNTFTFSARQNARITVSAIFTKLTQE